MASRPFPSDIPTASEITTGPDGVLRLHRRLLGPWRQDRRARDVLLAEIEANARVPLNSETLVPLVDQGDVPEPWLARRFFECGTLAHRIRRTDWPQGDELLTIVATLLKAFEELDRLGLTHGDPAPCNVFLTPEGTVRLGDLCSARARFAAAPDHQIAAMSDSPTKRTGTARRAGSRGRCPATSTSRASSRPSRSG